MSDPTIADWLGVGANLITTFAVAAGVLIAWRQLEAWKGEHVSKRRAEIAEQLLSAAYEVRSGLHATRSPMEFVSQDEGGRQDATIIK